MQRSTSLPLGRRDCLLRITTEMLPVAFFKGGHVDILDMTDETQRESCAQTSEILPRGALHTGAPNVMTERTLL